MDLVQLKTADNNSLPLLWYGAANKAAPKLLFLPAMGVKADFYATFAEALCQSGLSVAVMEQRGYGESDIRPSRKNDWGFKTLIEQDMRAALDWLDRESPEGKRILGGHSLGAQLAIACSGQMPERCDALLAIACASPYYDNYRGSVRRQIYWGNKIAPLLFALFGYFPGKKFGLGNNARTLMRDWIQLAQHNRFNPAGIDDGLEARIAEFDKATLSLSFARDPMAPRAAVAAMNAKLSRRHLQQVELDEATLGARADHFTWARQPRAVVDKICDWAEIE